MQTRIWNYGETFTSRKAAQAMAALHTPGVYQGFDISVVDVDVISLGSGYLFLPTGIVVYESSPIELTLYPLPSLATDYSIIVRHTNTDVVGGQAATYAIENGIVAQESLANGAVIGYIRYPGSAVPLDSSFILPALKQQAAAANSVELLPSIELAPLSPKWVVSSLGANTTISDTFVSPSLYTRLTTSGLGPVPPGYESTFLILAYKARSFRPFSIGVRARIDANSQIRLSMLDTDGNAVTLTNFILSPSSVFTEYLTQVAFGSGVFTPGDLYTLQLEVRTPSLASVDIQEISVNYDPLP